MRAAAKFFGIIADGNDAHFLAVFFSEKSGCAFFFGFG